MATKSGTYYLDSTNWVEVEIQAGKILMMEGEVRSSSSGFPESK